MLSTDDDDDDDGDDGQKRSRKANPLFSKTKIETILLQLKKMSLRLLSPRHLRQISTKENILFLEKMH